MQNLGGPIQADKVDTEDSETEHRRGEEGGRVNVNQFWGTPPTIAQHPAHPWITDPHPTNHGPSPVARAAPTLGHTHYYCAVCPQVPYLLYCAQRARGETRTSAPRSCGALVATGRSSHCTPTTKTEEPAPRRKTMKNREPATHSTPLRSPGCPCGTFCKPERAVHTRWPHRLQSPRESGRPAPDTAERLAPHTPTLPS